MTNLLLRRLVTKGYLRIRQLNRKKVEYLLTPRGLSEKLQKTYLYTLKTIESFSLIRSEVRRVLKAQLTPEIKRIVVVGRGELADLASLILHEFNNGTHRPIEHVQVMPGTTDGGTLVVNALTEDNLDGPTDPAGFRLLE